MKTTAHAQVSRSPTAPAPSTLPVPTALLQRKCACGGSAGVTGGCEQCRAKRLERGAPLQAKLRIGPPDDRFEREADRVAEAVVAGGSVGDESGRPKLAPGAAPAAPHSVRLDLPRGGGRPLGPGVRRTMEERIGFDFGRVRVHADEPAATATRRVRAHAFTVGSDVFFDRGRYDPGSTAGTKLLAHELAHVVQQTGPRSLAAIAEGPSGAVSRSTAPYVARQEAEGKDEEKQEKKEKKEKKKGPSCPVKEKGTLSEVSWGETSGLYPSSKNKYDPSKWDEAKTCELLKMRGAVHAVGKRGEPVHKGKPKAKDAIEQKLKPYHLIENFPALDSEIKDAGVKWFYLSPSATSSHPGIKGETRVKTYGKFYNVGGGDVKKGDVYVHFFKLKAKPGNPGKKQKQKGAKGTQKAPSDTATAAAAAAGAAVGAAGGAVGGPLGGLAAGMMAQVLAQQALSSSSKKVCLTFDDGPQDGTEEVLDVLKAKGAKGAFFLTGINMKKDAPRQRKLVARMIKEGHTIANHTYTHKPARKKDYLATYGDLSDKAKEKKFKANWTKNREHFEKLFAKSPTKFPGFTLARLPGDGRFVKVGKKHVYVEATESMGMKHVGWDFEFAKNGDFGHLKVRDWKGVTGVAAEVDRYPNDGDVVLFHDRHWKGSNGKTLFTNLLTELSTRSIGFGRLSGEGQCG